MRTCAIIHPLHLELETALFNFRYSSFFLFRSHFSVGGKILYRGDLSFMKEASQQIIFIPHFVKNLVMTA